MVLAEVAPRFSRIEDLEAALPEQLIVEELPRAPPSSPDTPTPPYRRAGGAREQILADFLIASHAAVTGRPLLTRDPRRVATYLPGAELISPEG